MLETSARLLRLLSFLQARRFWTGSELAAELEVTERTVRRDVDRLRSLGYPVQATAGVAGGYQLGAGAALPPLLLDDDEALAISLGLRTTASGSVSGMADATLRALAKLEQVMPPHLRKRVKNLHASIVPLAWSGPTVDADVLSALAGASRNHERARFRYQDGRGAESSRHVEPLGLVHTGTRWYLVAFDLDREDFRTFRVDRIAARPGARESKVTLGGRFVPREVPGGDLARYVSRSVSTEAYSFKARVILRAPLAQMAERVPPSSGRLEAVDEQSCLLHTGANWLDGLAMHIAMLGVDFEILDPPELKQALQALSARFARALQASPDAPP
ncbi:MAG: YafY family protein [Myxococcales bacterium]